MKNLALLIDFFGFTNVLFRGALRHQPPAPFAKFSLALAWFMFSLPAGAVSPPPDGGYPNANTAEGDNALFSLTTGARNTAIGNSALLLNTTGSDNTAVGNTALIGNTTG